jgi:putative oxidoreductase
MDAEAVGRFLVTAFFAVVFGQSALDKLLDRDGNIAYFSEHFSKSPIPSDFVPLLFWGLTVVESSAALFCALGVLTGSFASEGFGLAAAGVALSGVALLCLIVGQRLAKDYAGAAVVAAYFAVAVIGLELFG